MTHTIIVRPKARDEAIEAQRWYEKEREGLGAEFRRSVEETVSSIQQNPELYPAVYKSVRRALTERFPYGVFYRVTPERIEVLAVFHLKRDPQEWQSRR